MPADRPLSASERRVLDVLMQPDRTVEDRTVDAVAEASGLEVTDTWRALYALETHRPQLAQPDVDATLDIQFWRATPDAAKAATEAQLGGPFSGGRATASSD